MGRLARNLQVICPRCGQIGTLYYTRSIGFYVKHGPRITHHIRRNEALEVKLNDETLNFIHYMGADTLLLPILAKLIPPHTTYVEVFGGSAPLLLNKSRSKVEVYNDIDGNLVNLFRVVRDKYSEFVKRAEFLLYSRADYYYFVNNLDKLNDVDKAVATFFIYNAGYAGKFAAGFSAGPKRNQAPDLFNKLRQKLKLIHKRLQNVVIESLDFREIIKRYDTETTFFYLDPPHLYLGTEKTNDYYRVGEFSDKDYFDLLNMLTTIKGKFLLKQTNIVPYLEEWANKNGFSTLKITLKKNIPVKKATGKFTKGDYPLLFVANYKLPQINNEITLTT